MASETVRRRLNRNALWRRWTVAWLGGSVLGIVNGSLRELLYKDSVGELPAHYISTATLLVLLSGYMWTLQGRWPLASDREALGVGLTWLLLTASFDFGFGHFVARKSWRELAEDYDLAEGRVWSLILIWIAVAPSVMRHLREADRKGWAS